MSRTSSIGFATFSLENLLLGLLTLESAHGYQLYQEYETHFLPIWKVGRSKFYAALNALNEAGYLAVETVLQEDHPPRKVYHLTHSGHARFAEWLYAPVMPMRAIRVEFLAKLRFIELLPSLDAARIIDNQIAACHVAIAALAERAGETPDTTDREDDRVLALVHDFRHKQALFIIEWLKDCRQQLCQM